MRRLFKSLHLWLSIPAGLIIMLMCLTGAVMVFQEEILQVCYPEHYYVRDYSQQQPLSLDVIVEKANAALVNDTISAIHVFNDPERTYVATLSSGQRAHAYINPYTGEITGYYNYRVGFFHQIMRLHRWLMFKDMATGRVITGISTIFFVIILISGIVVWCPRKGKVKGSFFKVKWRSGGSRKLFDLHRILGIYAIIILLVLSLTGLMWSFGWYRSSVAAIFGIEQSAEGGGHGNRSSGHGQQDGSHRQQNGEGDGQQGGNRGSRSEQGGRTVEFTGDWWQQALTISQQQITNYKSIRIAKRGSMVTVLSNNASHSRANDTYSFSYEKNSIEPVSIYGEKKDQSYMMTWAYALHVGTWGGIWSKVLTFLAALIGASLPVTGYMLWFKKRRR